MGVWWAHLACECSLVVLAAGCQHGHSCWEWSCLQQAPTALSAFVGFASLLCGSALPCGPFYFFLCPLSPGEV